MKWLIIKDFKVLKLMNLWMIFMGMLFGFIGTTSIFPFGSNMVYGYGIFIMIYMFLMFSLQIEEKSKSYIMINSLPANKKDIVTARYISTIIYLLSSVIFILLISNISIGLFDISIITNSLSLFGILFIIAICLIFVSMYLPFQYYYMSKSQIFNALFYALLILLPNLINRYASKIEDIKWINYLGAINFQSFTFIILIIGVILYLISLSISQKIYKAKEFY